MPQTVAAAVAEVQRYGQMIDALLLYGGVWEHPVGEAFIGLLKAIGAKDPSGSLRAYGDWFQALATSGETWTNHLLRQMAYADNAFTRQAQTQDLEYLPSALRQAAEHDLAQLQQLQQLDPAQVASWVQAVAALATRPVVWNDEGDGAAAYLPPFQFAPDISWAVALPELAQHYRRYGTGQFAQYRAFIWQSNRLQGIDTPDPIQLSQLTAYPHPRQQLVQNTLALLKGYAALNVLLYGSRGAGKSSLVKALLNEYHARGLRLVEVSKAELHDLPQIVELLRPSPQKFIIFVDDLSFEEDDDAFKALKVVLEGGVTARPQNVVVYATSNRRHLVREYFSERPRPSDQDEVQAWDTLQEKLSFSDRFGLTLTFEPADQPTYLDIVKHLAQQADISLPEDDLMARALQWATRHNGRSGRTARQFIDWLSAELSGR
ncbi:MAG: ATP-binding protein [Nodosilinea sp.]